MAKSKNKISSSGGLVYSTNPNIIKEEEEINVETLAPNQQKLIVALDRKQRAGKTVTLVSGFEGSTENLTDLSKFLKTKCGSGGSVKEGVIIIQGDYKSKIFQFLLDLGYSKTLSR